MTKFRTLCLSVNDSFVLLVNEIMYSVTFSNCLRLRRSCSNELHFMLLHRSDCSLSDFLFFCFSRGYIINRIGWELAKVFNKQLDTFGYQIAVGMFKERFFIK